MNALSCEMRQMGERLRREAGWYDGMAKQIDQLPVPLGIVVVLPVLRGHQIEELIAYLKAGHWPGTAQAVEDALAREEAEIEVEEPAETTKEPTQEQIDVADAIWRLCDANDRLRNELAELRQDPERSTRS